MPDALYGGTLSAPSAPTTLYWSYGGFAYGGVVSGTVGGLVRSAADTVGTVTDTATHGSMHFARTGVDSVPVSDVAKTSIVTRGDSLSVSDSASHTPVKSGRLTADSVSVSDSATRTTPGFTRSALDIWGVTDVALRGGGITRLVSDSFSVSDAAVPHPGVSRAAVDSVGYWNDVATIRAVTLVRAVADVIAIRDSARGPAVLRLASDLILVNDLATIPGRADIAGMPFMLVRRTMI